MRIMGTVGFIWVLVSALPCLKTLLGWDLEASRDHAWLWPVGFIVIQMGPFF